MGIRQIFTTRRSCLMKQMEQDTVEKMVFRKTNSHLGRHISVSPGNSTMKHLTYGRIILNASVPKASFSNGDHETGLVCLSGSAEVKAGPEKFHLRQYDAIYIPRDTQIEVKTDANTDIAEFSADVEHRYPLQFVSYQQTSTDPSL